VPAEEDGGPPQESFCSGLPKLLRRIGCGQRSSVTAKLLRLEIESGRYLSRSVASLALQQGRIQNAKGGGFADVH